MTLACGTAVSQLPTYRTEAGGTLVHKSSSSLGGPIPTHAFCRHRLRATHTRRQRACSSQSQAPRLADSQSRRLADSQTRSKTRSKAEDSLHSSPPACVDRPRSSFTALRPSGRLPAHAPLLLPLRTRPACPRGAAPSSAAPRDLARHIGGVYSEKLLKGRASASIHWQNVQLYLWGVAFNAIGVYTKDRQALLGPGDRHSLPGGSTKWATT